MGNKKGFGGGEDVPSSQTFIQEEQLVERERAARRGEGVHSGSSARAHWVECDGHVRVISGGDGTLKSKT